MNEHEAHYRALKAERLLDVLQSVHADGQVDPETVQLLPDTFWLLLARAASVKPPSDATKALVVALARKRMETSVYLEEVKRER